MSKESNHRTRPSRSFAVGVTILFVAAMFAVLGAPTVAAAAPTLDATKTEALDTDGDGYIDEVKLVFSASMGKTGWRTGDWMVQVDPDPAAMAPTNPIVYPVRDFSGHLDGNTEVRLILTPPVATQDADTDAAVFVTYTDNGNKVHSTGTSGGDLAGFADTKVQEKAKAAVAGVKVVASDEKRIELVFSELVKGSQTASGGTAGDFKLSDFAYAGDSDGAKSVAAIVAKSGSAAAGFTGVTLELDAVLDKDDICGDTIGFTSGVKDLNGDAAGTTKVAIPTARLDNADSHGDTPCVLSATMNPGSKTLVLTVSHEVGVGGADLQLSDLTYEGTGGVEAAHLTSISAPTAVNAPGDAEDGGFRYVIGTDKAQPTGQRTVSRHPVTVRFGRPLDVSRYADQQDDPFALRSATDELMFEIMTLSGQEYIDEYASRVKSGDVDADAARPTAPAVPEHDEAEATDGHDGPRRAVS